MNIEKKDSVIVVELDGETIRYGDSYRDKGNYLTSDGVVKLEEWKIDLIKKHGVDLNELQS